MKILIIDNHHFNDMKIVSWNVNLNFEIGDMISRMFNIAQIIKQIDPDILLLQEASGYFLHYLKEIWKFRTASKVKSHGGLLCILISEKYEKEFVPIKLYCGIIIENLSIINCHLVHGNDSCAVEERNRFYGTIKRMIPSGAYQVIIGGDFNDSCDHIDTLLKLDDVGKIVDTPTWCKSFFENGSEIKSRYDRFFTDIKVKSFETLTAYCGHSDHIPILMDF